ncbi:MAG: ABC transporter ATP-binding protein [Candidatus Hydrogenedentota bacterium]
MDPKYLVELENVHKVFFTRHFLQRDEETERRVIYKTKRVQAARQVSFGICKGEIFGLLGPNGAGKTTTVKMISGLIRPTAGTVSIDGMNIEKNRLKALRKLGVVLEGTRTSIWPLTPLENLAYFGNLRDVRGPVLRRRSLELLDFVGLRDKMNVEVRKLSRGQKQKVAICIAMIADPPIVLLDEPTTGLDVQSSRSIKDKIREMTREQGKSVLVTTHDMHVAEEICDRIGIINEGELIACKPTDQLIDLFSDCTFVFQLDRSPDPRSFAPLGGVSSAASEDGEGGPSLVVAVAREESERSRALYALVEKLREERFEIRSITQRKQNLENVFLHLTGNGKSREVAG